MKQRNLRKYILLLLTLLLCVSFTPEQANVVGKVTFPLGNVLVLSKGETRFRKASFNMPVVNGDKIETKKQARCELTYNDGSVIRVDEQSIYTVEQAKPTPSDMVAIGTGAHVFVIGPAMSPDKLDLSQIDLALARNDEIIRKSPARDVLGNPWNSLLWCVNHLHKFGLALEPGMVVLTGTAAPAYKVKGEAIKGHYVGDCGPLGKVTMTLR